MNRLSLLLVLSAAMVCVSAAQEKRIVLRKGILVFAKDKAIREISKSTPEAPKNTKSEDPEQPPDDIPDDEGPPKGETKFAAVSANGKLAGVFDPKSKTITVYDQAGKKLRDMKTKSLFSQLAISDQGMAVIWGPWVGHPMNIPTEQDVAVYSPKGKLLASCDSVPLGNMHIRFLDQGKVVVLVLPTPEVKVVWADGQKWGKSLVPKVGGGDLALVADGDIAVSDIAVDQARLKVVFTTMALGDIGTPTDTTVHVYTVDPERPQKTGYHAWTQRGTQFRPGSIALSPDGKRLYAIEPRLVRCFNLQTKRRAWIDVIGNPDTGTTKPQEIAGVHASNHRVVTAHLVPTGKGWRVLYSVYTSNGKPVGDYKYKADSARGINSFLSNEIVADRVATPPWTLTPDGKALVTFSPKTKIKLSK